ncbi:hypothetical protein MNV49_005707 [Pseudohyphozyma bogoriensis]|nr:hypothetical protein MNV49_005707 [Pseudohyphozyma bogoriensis]
MIADLYIAAMETAPFVPPSTKNGTTIVSGTWDIFFKYCEPNGGVTQASVLEAVHGLVATADYWDVNLPEGDSTSFVKAATEAGYAVLAFDRLGVRYSSHPDPINVVQLGTSTAIALEINSLLRTDGLNLGRNFSRVVGVGHSFGSATLANSAATDPKAFDGLVLTGFSANSTVTPLRSGLAMQHLLASEAGIYAWKNLSSGYLITGSQSGDQLSFFSYPNYTQSAIDLFTDTKGTYTIGEWMTTVPSAATSYTNPLQVVTGDRDAIFCGGNCYDVPALPNGTYVNNTLDSVRNLFPQIGERFETYPVPGTGHGINFHPTAPMAYSRILDFLKKYDL